MFLWKSIVFLPEAEWCIHASVSKNIGRDNGMSPDWRQATIWTSAGILLTGPIGTNFSEILIRIHKFSFKKMHLKISSGKWRPFCLGLAVFIMYKKISYPNVSLSRRRGNWWTALYKSSSRSPRNVLLNKASMSDVARHVGPSIRITCRVIATKERKSVNWNLSRYQKTTFQGIPIVNIRQPGDRLIKNRALVFREWGRHSPAFEIFTEIREFWSGVIHNRLLRHVVKGAWNWLKGGPWEIWMKFYICNFQTDFRDWWLGISFEIALIWN